LILGSILDVRDVNPFVVFYDNHERKTEGVALFFYLVPEGDIFLICTFESGYSVVYFTF
jgi:hypothetical protein